MAQEDAGRPRSAEEAGEGRLPAVVREMVARVAGQGTVRHVCEHPLPRQERVVQVLALMSEVLFPGYFGRGAADGAALGFHVGEAMSRLGDLLAEEIARCMVHEQHRDGAPDRLACEAEGRRKALAVLGRMPAVLDLLDDDVRAAYAGDPAATGYDEVIFCYPGFRAIMIQRLAHALHEERIPWLPRIMTEHAHRLTGIDIHPAARIGRSFFIDHGTGVVIGETSEIGSNVRMYQGVTLGGYVFRKDEAGNLLRGYKRHPTIEDDVIIYANASILGPVTVGRGAVIGANVFLTHSVDAGARVTIEKPRHRIRRPGDG
jgi:serine O-acetyltransferase